MHAGLGRRLADARGVSGSTARPRGDVPLALYEWNADLAPAFPRDLRHLEIGLPRVRPHDAPAPGVAANGSTRRGPSRPSLRPGCLPGDRGACRAGRWHPARIPHRRSHRAAVERLAARPPPAPGNPLVRRGARPWPGLPGRRENWVSAAVTTPARPVRGISAKQRGRQRTPRRVRTTPLELRSRGRPPRGRSIQSGVEPRVRWARR